MINASEIRVGNWVEVKVDTNSSTVIEVTAEDIARIEENPELYNPVHLSDYIIDRFGFDSQVWRSLELPQKGIGSTERLSINGGWLSLEQESAQGLTNSQALKMLNEVSKNPKIDIDKLGFMPKSSKVLLMMDMLFVHKMQNLYFSLSGEELTFKP